MITRRGFYIEHIHSLWSQDIREGVRLQRLGCTHILLKVMVLFRYTSCNTTCDNASKRLTNMVEVCFDSSSFFYFSFSFFLSTFHLAYSFALAEKV